MWRKVEESDNMRAKGQALYSMLSFHMKNEDYRSAALTARRLVELKDSLLNKRISVTPIALVSGACRTDSYVEMAKTLDRAAKTCGVNFIGGFSALVQKGATEADWKLIRSIPEAMAATERVCASVNVGSTRAGINMDAVAEMAR